MQNKKHGLVPSKKTTSAFLKNDVEMGTLHHIPNSRGNPWRFAISLGVKYLSFSVDNFISFSSSGKSSMCLNTDSSYEEYWKQQISLTQAKYIKFNSHILTEYFFNYHSAKDNSVLLESIIGVVFFAAIISTHGLARKKSMLPWGRSSFLPPVTSYSNT